jgi:methionyl-tRNA formyltransferase
MGNDVNLAFLLIKEHPMGRVMINDLITAGCVPSIIIEEDTEGGVTRRKYYEDIMEKVPPTVEVLSAKHGIRRLEVSKHNSEECREALKEVQPDLMALGNCSIIKPYIYNIAKDGCINTHPGLLPLVRGVYPVVWSVYHDHPSGCCTHLVDDKLDTGPILYNEEFPVYRGDTVENLLEKACYLAGKLIVRAYHDYRGDGLKALPQTPGDGNYYSTPTQEVFAAAAQKMKDQTYKHFAD